MASNNNNSNGNNEMEDQLQQLSLRSGSPLPTLMASTSINTNDATTATTATLTPMQASPIAAASPDRPSAAPMFPKAVVRHHELTPVTRNTSFLETSNPIVSPDDYNNNGEDRLSLPSAEQFADSATSTSNRPPFAQRRSNNNSNGSSSLTFPTILMDKRAMSLTNINDIVPEEESFEVEDDEDDDWVVTNGGPVDFPSRNKFYSFNSRHQYKDQACNNSSRATNRLNIGGVGGNATSPAELIPYQPTRQDLENVGTLPQEELSLIFNNRDNAPSSLQTQIPLGERQWSIPSIRMANALTEYSGTDYTDEEDDLDDNASLSSRGSSLYLPEEYESSGQVVRFTPTAGKPVVIFEGELPDIPLAPVTSFNNTVAAQKRRRHDSSSSDNNAPFAWLKSVEQQQGGDMLICEAASSKFLCSKSGKNPTVLRQKSSPLY